MRADLYQAGQEFVFKTIESSPELSILKQGDSIASISPSETLFGYTYHAHMVPPFQPESILILGYGKGQIADLIRMVWGSAKITGIDLVSQDWKYIENKMYVMDAYEFVRDCTNSIIKKRYDYIVIDLFDGENVPEFVFYGDFAIRIRQMTKRLVCVNTLAGDFDKMKNFNEYGLRFHRMVPIFGNVVSYWGV